MYEFSITKERRGRKVRFDFLVYEKVDNYGKLYIDYRINGSDLYHAEDYWTKNKVIKFYTPHKIFGIKVGGITIPAEHARKLEVIKKRAIEVREQETERQFKNNLIFDYYFGDWYRANGWFVEVDDDIVVIDYKLEKHIKGKYSLDYSIESIKEKVEKFFSFRNHYQCFYTKEEIDNLKAEIKQKYGLNITEKEVKTDSGSRYYVSEIAGSLENWDKVFDEIFLPILKRKAEKEKALEEKKQKAIEEAKRTGKKVFIERIGGYSGDDIEDIRTFGTKEILNEYYSSGELGWVNVYLVAYPDGTVKEEHIPSY